MKIVNLLFLAAFTFPVAGQRVITVRSQHTRKLINTLKENENIMRGETRILVRTDGEEYEYLTMLDGKYRLYKNDVLEKVLPYPMFEIPSFYSYMERVDGNRMMYGKIGSKQIGPYQELRFYSSAEGRSSVLYGYSFKSENSYFIEDRVAGKKYGPYDELKLLKLDREHLLFSCKKDGKWYVGDRKGMAGPYEKIEPVFASTQAEGLAYAYLEKGVWRIHCRTEVPQAFSEQPSLRFAADGTWEICGTQEKSDGKQRILLQDGTTFEHTSGWQTIRYPGLPVLTAESSDNGQNPGFNCRFEHKEVYRIRRGDEVLGDFYVEPLYGALIGESDKIYPLVFYRKIAEKGWNSRQEFYLLHVEKGFVGPIPASARYSVSIGGDGYAYIEGKERNLFMNGEKQERTDVETVDMSEYPKAWYMAAKEGYYTVIYKNGREDRSGTLEKKFPRYRYMTRDLPFIIVRENDKSYAKTPNSSKLFGPVNPRSIIVFSAGNAHFAEGDERAATVLIDGKVIGSGYGIVYNSRKNAFHWVSQEGRKLYMHTYELD